MMNTDSHNNSILRRINDYKYTELTIKLEFFAFYKKMKLKDFVNYKFH